MDRVNKILNNDIYKMNLEKLNTLEVTREFCRHDMEHFIAVARIAYIMVLERGLPYSKELIYAIALLHDIGRVLEYEENIPHHEASVILSKKILKDIDFTKVEKGLILEAIEAHRGEANNELCEIIYKSDKLSRECFRCNAEKECYWSKEKKNYVINY